jgi:hypothetical protein
VSDVLLNRKGVGSEAGVSWEVGWINWDLEIHHLTSLDQTTLTMIHVKRAQRVSGSAGLAATTDEEPCFLFFSVSFFFFFWTVNICFGLTIVAIEVN